MKDKITITTDGVCVYINSKIQLCTLNKVGVLLISLFAFTPFFLMLFAFSSDISKELVIAMIIYLILVGSITLRFALWKFFGEEFISVSTKSIKYVRSYGFFRTNLKTIDINELAINFNKTETDKDGNELGNIYFYNYDHQEQSNLVFESTMYMNHKQYEKLENQLDLVFYNKSVKNGEMSEITLN